VQKNLLQSVSVAQASLDKGLQTCWDYVNNSCQRGTRSLTTPCYNDACPQIEVDPDTFEVRVNGELLRANQSAEYRSVGFRYLDDTGIEGMNKSVARLGLVVRLAVVKPLYWNVWYRS